MFKKNVISYGLFIYLIANQPSLIGQSARFRKDEIYITHSELYGKF